MASFGCVALFAAAFPCFSELSLIFFPVLPIMARQINPERDYRTGVIY